MLNQQTLQGNWNEIKGRIQSRWGQISGDDLDRVQGDVEQLVGTIQRQTGLARTEIEKYLDDVAGEGSSRVERARQAGQAYAQQAAGQIQHASHQAGDAARRGYSQAQHVVQDHPMQSLATCFGIGVVTGVVVGLLIRSK